MFLLLIQFSFAQKNNWTAIDKSYSIRTLAEKNTDNKIADIYTGGSAQVLLASLDFYYSKWMVQTMIYKPLQVNLAEAMPQNDFAFSIGVAYFLNSNKH